MVESKSGRMTPYRFDAYPEAVPSPAVAPSSLYGVWIVDDFGVNEISPRPLFTEKLARDMSAGPRGDRWTELIFDAPDAVMIQLSNGVLDYAKLTFDQVRNTASVSDEADPDWKCDFAYQRIGDQLLNSQGNINGNSVALKLHL